MIGKCNLNIVKDAFKKILNKECKDGISDFYIQIVRGNGEEDVVGDNADIFINEFLLYNAIMDGDIYVMNQDEFQNDESINEEKIDIIELDEIEEYFVWENENKVLYIGYNTNIEEAFEIYLKEITVLSDGTRCFY